MAVVPRRRSLIGRAAARAGATGADGSAREPDDGPRLDVHSIPSTSTPEGAQTALHAARPGARPRDSQEGIRLPESLHPGVLTSSGLEIVEHGRPGRGFEGVAAQDSFAMDDPPSEEVRLDPRFARAFEPATELMDRQQLAAFGRADSLTEDDLDAVLPPVKASRSVTPSPLTRGWIPSESSKSRTPVEDPATERMDKPPDPATERIERDQIPPELLAEKTVPTSWSAGFTEMDDGPPPSDATQPFDTGTQPSLIPRPPDYEPEVLQTLYPDEAPAEMPTAPSAVRRSSAEPWDDEEQAKPPGLSPVFGLVALVGSGGVIAGIALGALVFTVLFLVVYSGTGSAPPDPGPLPPIELVPDPALTPPVPVEEAPTGEVVPVDDEEPEGDTRTPPKRSERGSERGGRTPKPVPVVAPEPPPPPPRPEPENLDDLPDLEPIPVPEPDKKGPFGRGKKK